MVIIGDVHGKIEEYLQVRDNFKRTLQLGDMGFGSDYLKIPTTNQHYFFKGNHDDYSQRHPNDIGDFGYWENLWFIRGAESPDHRSRTFGLDWFVEEQLNMVQAALCLSRYTYERPDIVVTHDCPQFLVDYPPTATRRLLEEMWNNWQPSLWIYGHHHKYQIDTIGNTQFVALNELECFDVEKGTYILS